MAIFIKKNYKIIKVNRKKCQKIKVFSIYRKNFTKQLKYVTLMIGDKNDKERFIFK